MQNYQWYAQLIKPAWAPPATVFGPVWTFLYILIATSFGYVGYMWYKGKIGWIIVLPFILNLVFNVVFTPLQFGLQNLVLASIDVILVWITLVWAMIAVYPYARWVTYINIPYLAWVSFASVLQIYITVLNG